LRAASRASSFIAPAFTKKIPSMPEPHPERRPVCSPIALNKLDQRIDLKLPRPSLRTRNGLIFVRAIADCVTTIICAQIATNQTVHMIMSLSLTACTLP
jgi:hypothetical protein